MKVRIEVGLGTHTASNDAGQFGELVDQLEERRSDSLWLSERLTGDASDRWWPWRSPPVAPPS